MSSDPAIAASEAESMDAVIKSTRIIKVDSFRKLLGENVFFEREEQQRDIYRVGAWLDWILLGHSINL